MLLFILAFFHCFSAPSLFQYISCYCLSKDKREPQQVQTDFNTSHVTVYLKINNAFSKFHNISIHLMLLFIITFIGILPIDFHFNTSHVTVYPDRLFEQPTISLFQYISCYCLSFSSISITALICISIHLMLLFIQLPDSMRFIKDWFQYISCYCLSCFVSWSVNGEPISIHLMLLFIETGDRHLNW